MPELPEIEILAQNLRPILESQKVDCVVFYRDDLREKLDKNTISSVLNDQRIQEVWRRSKYLILRTNVGEVAFHLGMSGQILISPSPEPQQKHTHVIIRSIADLHLHFIDPRRFGRLVAHKKIEDHPFFTNLGVEPLLERSLANILFKRSRSRNAPIKSFIMDADVVVGIGNIYASEALFEAGIWPMRSANSMSLQTYKRLTLAIRKTLKRAINLGGSSIRDYRHHDGKLGGFQNSFRVYGRTGLPCSICQSSIAVIQISGRSTYFCPVCQQN